MILREIKSVNENFLYLGVCMDKIKWLFFDIVITSAECGCAKPDLKIFKMALEQANCTTDECVMIGDRIDNDIAPAKQLGMKTVWVRQGFSKYQSAKSVSVQPNFIVDKVSELVKIFK